MPTYIRAFTAEPGEPLPGRVVDESLYLPAACRNWIQRANDLGLPKTGERRTRDMEAFIQGAIACATALGVMSHGRAEMIGLLAAVGRLTAFVKSKAAEGAE